MKESLWGYWIVVLGLFVIVVMMLLQNFTTTKQQDYYLLREVTQAAMHEAINYQHFRETGEVRIVKEKFVENWLRRFAETVNISRTYDIRFYDIWEAPPKATIIVSSLTDAYATFQDVTEMEIVSRLDAIFEYEPIPESEELCHFRTGETITRTS